MDTRTIQTWEQRLLYQTKPGTESALNQPPPKGELVASNPHAGEKQAIRPTEDQRKILDKNENDFNQLMLRTLDFIKSHLGNTRYDQLRRKTSEQYGKYAPIIASRAYPKCVQDAINLYNSKAQTWENAKNRPNGSAEGLIAEQSTMLEFGPSGFATKLDDLELQFAGPRPETVAEGSGDRFEQLVNEGLNALQRAVDKYNDRPTEQNRRAMVAALNDIDQRVSTEESFREQWGQGKNKAGQNRLAELRKIVADAGDRMLAPVTVESDTAYSKYTPFKGSAVDEKSIAAARELLAREEQLRSDSQPGTQSPDDTAIVQAQQQFNIASPSTQHDAMSAGRLALVQQRHEDLRTLPENLARGIADIGKFTQRAAELRSKWNPEKATLTDAEVKELTDGVARLGRIEQFFRAHHATDADKPMQDLAAARNSGSATLALNDAEKGLQALTEIEKRSGEIPTGEAGKALLARVFRARDVLRTMLQNVARTPDSPWKSSLIERLAGTQQPDPSNPEKHVWVGGAAGRINGLVELLGSEPVQPWNVDPTMFDVQRATLPTTGLDAVAALKQVREGQQERQRERRFTQNQQDRMRAAKERLAKRPNPDKASIAAALEDRPETTPSAQPLQEKTPSATEAPAVAPAQPRATERTREVANNRQVPTQEQRRGINESQ